MAVASTGSLNTSPQSRKLLLPWTVRPGQAGDDHAGPLVAAHDQPEEQTGLEAGEGQVADLVDDQDLGVDQLLEAAFQPVLLLSAHQAGHEALQGQEQDRSVTQ